jgi:hypothetical protein
VNDQLNDAVARILRERDCRPAEAMLADAIVELRDELAVALAECEQLRDGLADATHDLLEANKTKSAAAALLGASVPDTAEGA